MGFKYNELIYRLVDGTIEYTILAILFSVLLVSIIVYNKRVIAKTKQIKLLDIIIFILASILLINTKIIQHDNFFDINVIIYIMVLITLVLKGISKDNTALSNIFSFISIFILVISSTIVQDVAYGDNFNAVISNPTARLILTLAIYFAVVSLIFFIFGNIKASTMVYSVIFSTLLMVNFTVLQGRGTSLQYNDFIVFRTALNVASGYSLDINYNISTGLLIVIFSVSFIINILPGDIKFSTKILERISPVILIYLSIFMIAPYTNQNTLENCKIYPRVFQENNYGLAVNLYSGAILNKLEPPNNYEDSAKLLDKFSETGDIDINTIDSSSNLDEDFYSKFYTSLDFLENKQLEKPDNIVVVMAESLCDLSYSDCIEATDYIPFIHSLINDPDVITGEYFSPSLAGGGTAQSEFEVLTGGTTDALKTDFYAYQTYIKSEYPSIINNMKQSGYKTFAIHNFDRSGYNRENVYKFFGFDSIHFDDDPYFENAETLRGFIKDKYGFNFILDTIDSTDEPTFSLFVTMEGHGEYNRGFGVSERINNLDYTHIGLTNKGEYPILEEWQPKVDEYCIAQADFDDALMNFINSLKESDEKTLVVLYGDHRWGHDLFNNDRTSIVKSHMTPLIIWSNYDLPDVPDNKQLFVGSCYLGSIICKVGQVGLTNQNRLMLKLYENMPGLGVACYVDHNFNLERHYNKLKDKTTVDLIRAMTYQEITKENKEFYWNVS